MTVSQIINRTWYFRNLFNPSPIDTSSNLGPPLPFNLSIEKRGKKEKRKREKRIMKK
jgi:hypothetical protein